MIHDFIAASIFVFLVSSPCVIAVFCADQRRSLFKRKVDRCPSVDRRDPR